MRISDIVDGAMIVGLMVRPDGDGYDFFALLAEVDGFFDWVLAVELVLFNS